MCEVGHFCALCWYLQTHHSPVRAGQVELCTHTAGEHTLIQWQTLFVMLADINQGVKLASG